VEIYSQIIYPKQSSKIEELDTIKVAFSDQFLIKIQTSQFVDGCKCMSDTQGLFSGAAALISDAQHKGMYKLLCKRTNAKGSHVRYYLWLQAS
jgi:hypothetical protein